jgi:hypothetical protein
LLLDHTAFPHLLDIQSLYIVFQLEIIHKGRILIRLVGKKEKKSKKVGPIKVIFSVNQMLQALAKHNLFLRTGFVVLQPSSKVNVNLPSSLFVVILQAVADVSLIAQTPPSQKY